MRAFAAALAASADYRSERAEVITAVADWAASRALARAAWAVSRRASSVSKLSWVMAPLASSVRERWKRRSASCSSAWRSAMVLRDSCSSLSRWLSRLCALEMAGNGLGPCGLSLVQVSGQGGGIHAGQDLPGAHPIPFPHIHLQQTAGSVGGHIDIHGLQAAIAAGEGRQTALVELAPGHRGHQRDAGHGSDREPDPPGNVASPTSL